MNDYVQYKCKVLNQQNIGMYHVPVGFAIVQKDDPNGFYAESDSQEELVYLAYDYFWGVE